MNANFLFYKNYEVYFYYGVETLPDIEFVDEVISFFHRNLSQIHTFPSLEQFRNFFKIVKFLLEDEAQKKFVQKCKGYDLKNLFYEYTF